MGWFTDITNWGRRVLQSETAAEVASYSYKTVSYLFEQVAVIPKVAYSAVMHQQTRTVAHHIWHIAAHDLMPLVLINFTSQLLQERGRAYLDNKPEEDKGWLSSAMALEIGIYLLQAAAWTARVHLQTRLAAHTAIVAIEASPMLNGVKTTPPMTVCRDEKCSALRFAQGTVRDLVTYFATEAAISFIGYVPMVGGKMAAALSVYHQGRYALTVVLPDLCNRHQVIYLRENSELALSLGLAHAGTSALMTALLQKATGIPTIFYDSTIQQLMLIIQMSVAAHLTLPAPKKASTRSLPDPVLFYQDAVGLLVDITLLGLKAKIPRLLNGKSAGSFKEKVQRLPWAEASRISERIRHHRLARMLLPSLLHDATSFIHDPLISSNWLVLQRAIIQALQMIESLKSNPAVRLSSTAPGITSTVVQTVSGTPKFFTQIALQLVTDADVNQLIQSWRQRIEALQLSPSLRAATGTPAAVSLVSLPLSSSASAAITAAGGTSNASERPPRRSIFGSVSAPDSAANVALEDWVPVEESDVGEEYEAAGAGKKHN